MSDTPTLTVDFNQNAIRRGAIPTPDGALPSKRRNRRGMVNLAAWDAKVAADNQARGTESTSDSPSLVELIQANVTPVASAPADEPDQAIAPPQGIAPAPKPGEPDLPPSPSTPQPPKTSLGAILEEQDGGKPQTPVELPPPDPAAVEAAKAALAAEAAKASAPAVDDPTIPPPPARRATSANKPPKEK